MEIGTCSTRSRYSVISKITDARSWLKITTRDWIKANKKVHEFYPLNRRFGIVSHAIVQASLVNIYRVDKELGPAKTKKFMHLVDSLYFFKKENTTRKSMSANDFFDYCKSAYIAGKQKDDHVDENMTGREMYERYADGRHDGLLDIDLSSEQEFADWIDGTHPKKNSGGHPWEIKRGGNTTHIDLYVTRPFSSITEDFVVTLDGPSFTRLKETLCIFLAIQKAGLPISIADPEGVYRRLSGQDNLGIVPCHRSLHRTNQHYPEHRRVYDVLHYDDFGRYKRRITPFITWEPLPILRPK